MVFPILRSVISVVQLVLQQSICIDKSSEGTKLSVMYVMQRTMHSDMCTAVEYTFTPLFIRMVDVCG
jgi:hypothetical protein